MSAPTPNLPLAGLKLVELGHYIAAPFATRLLADLGAEVIKVEPPGGDPVRGWGSNINGNAVWFSVHGRNKLSVTLDLKKPDDRAKLIALLRRADGLIENFRAGYLERIGLGPDVLHRENPRLVIGRISGYGQDGPYSQRPGFAAIAECMGGLRYTSGFPDRPPVRVGVSLGDTLASLYGTIGALMAMHHLKVNGGQGQFIDVALYEAVFGIMESLVPEYQMQGFVRERSGASMPGIAPTNTYRCRDGLYVAIAGNGDGIFRRFMQAIDRPDLAQDPVLASNDGRAVQAQRLDDVISDWTGQRTLAEVLAVLESASVPAGRIYTAADIAADPHYAARGMIEHHHLPDGQPIDLPGIVPKLSATPGATQWLGPTLGEHTADVLASIGIDAAALEHLRSQGVV